MLKFLPIVVLLMLGVHSHPEGSAGGTQQSNEAPQPSGQNTEVKIKPPPAKKWPKVKTGPIVEAGRELAHKLAISPSKISKQYCADKCKPVYERNLCEPSECTYGCERMAEPSWFNSKEDCYKNKYGNCNKVGCNIGFELRRRWKLEPPFTN